MIATNANVIAIALGIGVILGAAVVLATLWLITSRNLERRY